MFEITFINIILVIIKYLMNGRAQPEKRFNWIFVIIYTTSHAQREEEFTT